MIAYQRVDFRSITKFCPNVWRFLLDSPLENILCTTLFVSHSIVYLLSNKFRIPFNHLTSSTQLKTWNNLIFHRFRSIPINHKPYSFSDKRPKIFVFRRLKYYSPTCPVLSSLSLLFHFELIKLIEFLAAVNSSKKPPFNSSSSIFSHSSRLFRNSKHCPIHKVYLLCFFLLRLSKQTLWR